MVRGGGATPLYEVRWWRDGRSGACVARTLMKAVEPIIGRGVIVDAINTYTCPDAYAEGWAGDISDIQTLGRAKEHAFKVAADTETLRLLDAAYEKIYRAESVE